MTDISCADEGCRFNHKGKCESEEIELEDAHELEGTLNCLTREGK